MLPATFTVLLIVLGGDVAGGSIIQTTDDVGGTPVVETVHHATDAANQIGEVFADGASDALIVSDPAGNLACDGTYYYHYDAFNRLVQVNLVGSAVLDSDGRVLPGSTLGDMIARYVHDSLGRLARKETPLAAGQPDMQKKDFYYDGVRRVQAVPGGIDGNHEAPSTCDKMRPLQRATWIGPVDSAGVALAKAHRRALRAASCLWPKMRRASMAPATPGTSLPYPSTRSPGRDAQIGDEEPRNRSHVARDQVQKGLFEGGSTGD